MKVPDLPRPTVAHILAQIAQRFDADGTTMDVEQSLHSLVDLFPGNKNFTEVLVKVLSINQLYSTQIYAVRRVASRIVELDIDSYLEAGSIQIVEDIARLSLKDKVRFNRSFASKYCSWHQPSKFPIYDRNVELCLWAYKKQYGLSYPRSALWNYPSFVDAVVEFRDRFSLGSLTFKQLDKFMWLEGDEIIRSRGARQPRAEADGPYATVTK